MVYLAFSHAPFLQASSMLERFADFFLLLAPPLVGDEYVV